MLISTKEEPVDLIVIAVQAICTWWVMGNISSPNLEQILELMYLSELPESTSAVRGVSFIKIGGETRIRLVGQEVEVEHIFESGLLIELDKP